MYIQEMYFYLQDDIVSNNFINRINFSGIFSFKCGFKNVKCFFIHDAFNGYFFLNYNSPLNALCKSSKIGFNEQNLILMLIKSKPMNLNFDIMLGTWNWYILY